MRIRKCGSNGKSEDQTNIKAKKSLVQEFPQTMVFISKFLRFSTNPKVEDQKKGLPF